MSLYKLDVDMVDRIRRLSIPAGKMPRCNSGQTTDANPARQDLAACNPPTSP